MTGGASTYLPSLTELRAAAVTRRRRSVLRPLLDVDDHRGTTPDRELLDIVTGRFTSVDDAYERLRQAEAHFRDRHDRRSVFLTIYATMTAKARDGIESGAFDDAEWVRRSLVTFAEWYRRALANFERETVSAVPLPWRLGFSASLGNHTLLIQDALLGINAHINYDLPYTLREIAIDPDRPAKRRDHDRVNAILRQLVDVVQRALATVYAATGYAHIDTVLGSFDEDFTFFGLTEARRLAWENAVRLTDTGRSLLQRFVDWRIGTVATGAATVILTPSADRRLLWALRHVEGTEPPIDALVDEFHSRAAAKAIQIPD